MKTVASGETRRVVAIDSAGEMTDDERGSVVVCGSHGAPNATSHLLRFGPGAVIFHDAGKGKDDYAISCLAMLERERLACATVDCFSARIGDSMDLWENGTISAVNGVARELGITPGTTVADAAAAMLRHLERRG